MVPGCPSGLSGPSGPSGQANERPRYGGRVNEASEWLAGVRNSHDRLAALVEPLGAEAVRQPSACSEWSIAQVLSHLGSQAEIFSLMARAALSGEEPPSTEAFPPIWDRWNAKSPTEQAADALAANGELVRFLEGLSAQQLADFHVVFGGSMELDAATFLRMRLSEHAVHTWDIAVVLEPGATVAADAVALLIDGLPEMAARTGKGASRTMTVAVSTSDPARQFRLLTSGPALEPAADARGAVAGADASLELPAEALLRLVYGRLSDRHPAPGPIKADGVELGDLLALFPGF